MQYFKPEATTLDLWATSWATEKNTYHLRFAKKSTEKYGDDLGQCCMNWLSFAEAHPRGPALAAPQASLASSGAGATIACDIKADK